MDVVSPGSPGLTHFCRGSFLLDLA